MIIAPSSCGLLLQLYVLGFKLSNLRLVAQNLRSKIVADKYIGVLANPFSAQELVSPDEPAGPGDTGDAADTSDVAVHVSTNA
jgi:hypothetical protein